MQISEGSDSYVFLDVQVNILEGGVLDSLFPEADLVFDGEENDVTELQVGDDVSMAVMFRVVALLQSENCQIVLGVPRLRIKVVPEVEHEGGEGRRVEAPGVVQSHEEVEDDLQLLEDSHEASRIRLAFEGQVAKDFFIGLGITGQFLVLGCQLNDLSDFFLDHRNAGKRHFEDPGRWVGYSCSFCRKLDGHWRLSAWHARYCHNSRGGTRQGVRRHDFGNGRKF